MSQHYAAVCNGGTPQGRFVSEERAERWIAQRQHLPAAFAARLGLPPREEQTWEVVELKEPEEEAVKEPEKAEVAPTEPEPAEPEATEPQITEPEATEPEPVIEDDLS